MGELGKPLLKKSDQKNLKQSRTSPDVQFKEFSLTKKLDLDRTMNELEKSFLKNQIKKIKKKSMSKCRM